MGEPNITGPDNWQKWPYVIAYGCTVTKAPKGWKIIDAEGHKC